MRKNHIYFFIIFSLLYMIPLKATASYARGLWFASEVVRHTIARGPSIKDFLPTVSASRKRFSTSIAKEGDFTVNNSSLKESVPTSDLLDQKRKMDSLMKLFSLEGKTALIIGASSGIGERSAHALAEGGAKVILAARRFDKLQNIATNLKERGFEALAVEMDITDKKSVKEGIEVLEKRGEKIDINLNSAGIFNSTPVFGEDEENYFESIINTNLLGTWNIIKHVASHMKANRIQGSIINISSINGANKLRKNMSGYCASKAGVIQLTKACVGELAAEKIRINCILPGLFHTPLTNYKLSTPETCEQLAKRIPLHFVPYPTDLDGTILYLASNEASRYVTGSIITVDGGVSWGGDSIDLQ